jgi:penicillin-binding protein 1A
MHNLKNLLFKLKIVFPKIILYSFFLFVFSNLFFCTGSFLEWMEIKDRVKADLDRFESEISQDYDTKRTLPVKILDKNEQVIGEFHRKNYKPIRMDNLDKHYNLIWALLSSEDREFYNHKGINLKAIFRAIFVNLTNRKFTQGGSTITQQLAKITINNSIEENKIRKRTIFNKLTELYCTFYIERQYEKDKILIMYMNHIFMGENNTGLEEASKYYFNKSAKDLTPAESAILIGVIPAPSVFNPVRNLAIALQKQKTILNVMGKNPHLNPNQSNSISDFTDKIPDQIRKFIAAYDVKEIKGSEKKKFTSRIASYGYDRDFIINLAPDFNETIRRYVLSEFPSEELERRSVKVYTTLDFKKQQIGQIALREEIDKVRGNLEKRKEEFLKKDNKEEVKREKSIIDGINGSLVSMNPYTGNIEVLIGSDKISKTFQINRAEEIKRQPGSVIKGLIYALALEKRIINPSSIVVDEKIDFGGYSPKNWYAGFKGPMTARQAMGLSVNTVSVKLLKEIGVKTFLTKLSMILSLPYSEIEERMGNNLSLALGSGELSPLELSIIYSTIANGGKSVRPKRILKVVDGNGEVLRMPEEEISEQIIDPIACAMAINLMEAVLSGEGTVGQVKDLAHVQLAGKSGTVQTPTIIKKKWNNRSGVRDSWFAGIAPGLVSIVWIGNDQGAPFPGSGSGTTGKVWLNYTIAIKKRINFEDALIRSFDGDYNRVDICGDNGELLIVPEECKFPLYGQYYFRGDEPKAEQGLSDEEIKKIFSDKINGLPEEEGETDDDIEGVDRYESNWNQINQNSEDNENENHSNLEVEPKQIDNQ